MSRDKDNDDLSTYDKINQWMSLGKSDQHQSHDSPLVQTMTLESVTVRPTPSEPNHCLAIFSLTVQPSMCNHTGNLHGGAAATIFDACTSMSLFAIAREGFWDAGHVSRTLNCTYLRPVPGGEKIFVECEVVHAGKRMCLLKGVIKMEGGKVCVTCEHNKAAVGGSSL